MSLSAACSKLIALLRSLNVSSSEALLSVPGLGPTRVARILGLQKAAEARGRAFGVGELLAVPGISANLLAKIVGDPRAAILLKFATYYRALADSSLLVKYSHAGCSVIESTMQGDFNMTNQLKLAAALCQS